MGVEHGGQQGQQETAATSTFQLVLVDVPVEIIVGVAPPLDFGPLGGKWCCQREQGLVEVAIDIDDGLLSGCVNRAGRTGFGSPAELSITIVLLLEPPVDVTEVAQVLEGAGGQKVVDDVQHGQASPAACACRCIN